MVKLRSICQAVNEIKQYDPDTAMTEGFLRQLIENGDISSENCGARICVNLNTLIEELADLFELDTNELPILRTVKGAAQAIKQIDSNSFLTEYKIRLLIKSGRLCSYAVGSRFIIVMQSFDNRDLLTKDSREGSNFTQGKKISEQYSGLLENTTQSYTCVRNRA